MTDSQSTDERNAQRFSGWGISMMQQKPTTEYVLASDYDAERLKRLQAVHERDCAVEDVKRILTVVGNYVRTKKADMGESVVHWMDLQEIAKHLDVGDKHAD